MNQLVTTKRGVFNVRLYGDASLPPLVLVHGWPQTSYCWHHCVPYLGEYHIIAPDLRGLGDSNRALDKKHYHKDEMARDLFAVMDTLGINDFHLGGHDWGGAIVQEMAIINPARIRKLIIINMVIINNRIGKRKASEVLVKQHFRSSWYQFFMSIPQFPEAMIAGKEELWVRFFNRGISNPVPEDAMLEYIRCYQIPNTVTTAANLYRVIPKDRLRWREEYRDKVVEIPTKIIHGVLDPVIIKEYIEGAEEFYPDLSVATIEAGHFVVDEQPEAVAMEIGAFLRGE